MSQWTHVNASIRFDGILGMGQPTEKDLGQICRFGDEQDWENSIIPCGSEGSIEYKIVKTGDENDMASMVVVFTGDLRDYDDANEIIKYFNDIVKERMIRSGILEIEVEFQYILILQYDYEKKSFVTVAKSKIG